MGRKQAMMPLAANGDTGRRVVTTLVVLVVIALIIRDPVGAAHAVRHVLDALATFAAAF